MGTLRAITGASPVPLTAGTEEDIHAQPLPDSQPEFVSPVGTASFSHLALRDRLSADFT